MKYTWKVIRNIILIFLLVGLIAYLIFNKFSGKDKLQQLVVRNIAENLGSNTQISGLSFLPNVGLKADDIKLVDDQGEWLTIKGARIYPRISSSFKKYLNIVVGEIIYKRYPNIDFIKDRHVSTLNQFLNSQFSGKIFVDRVVILNQSNNTYEAGANGNFEYFGNKLSFNLNLDMQNNFPIKIENDNVIPIAIDGYYDRISNKITIKNLSSQTEMLNLITSANIVLDKKINYEIEAKINISNLALINQELGGNLESNFIIRGKDELFDIQGTSAGVIKLSTKEIDLTGDYSAQLEYEHKKKIINIREIDIKYPFGNVQGNTTVQLDKEAFSSSLNVNYFDLSKVSNYLKGIINLTSTINNNNNSIQFNVNTNGDIFYKNKSYIPINITGNFKGYYDSKYFDLDFIAQNSGKAKIKAIKEKDSIIFKTIDIQDRYNNNLIGNIKFFPNNKHIIGELVLQGNNFDKYINSLKGEYNATISLNDSGKDIQNFNLLINRSASPCVSSFKILTKGMFNFLTEYFSIEHLVANYDGTDIVSDYPIKIKKEKDNYKFDISRLRWKNEVLFTAKGEVSDKNISTKLDIDLPVEAIFNNILSQAHQLTGKIIANLDIQGNISGPKITGLVDLNNLTYRNLDLGLSINNLSAHLISNNNALISNNCRVYDMNNAIHQCSAKIEINERLQNIVLALNSDDFYIDIPGSNLKGTIKTDILLNIGLNETILSGVINARALDIRIPQNIVPSTPELNIVEINKEAVNKTTYPFIIKIDVKVPDILHVKGRGVDAQLGGDISIKTKEDHNFLEGKLSTIKGRYEEFGKEFNIVKGDLIFHDRIPPAPFLDIEGLYKHDSANLYIALTGPLLKPDLNVYSRPSLSTEEILSLILYGKNTQEISPVEAIMLGNNFRRLTGRSDGNFDVLGKARELLHIDELKFSGGDEKNPSLQIGKHITDKILLRIEKGLKEGTAKTMVEYEILPYLTIDGEFGEEGHSGIGINWKRDF